MALQRIFLGERRDYVSQAFEHLLEAFGSGTELNLQHLTLVSRSKRAGRLLLEKMALESEKRRLTLSPPRFCSSGDLPEILLASDREFISDQARKLVWLDVLRNAGAKLAALLQPVPCSTDISVYSALAARIDSIYTELRGAGLDFSSVAARFTEDLAFNDQERWRVLAELEESFAARLSNGGLYDRHIERARALLADERPGFTGKLCLFGCADLNRVSEELLTRFSGEALVLVCGREDYAELFSACGVFDKDAWAAHRLDIPDRVIKVAAGPADQAEAIISALSLQGSTRSPEEISIGLCDSELIPFVMQRLSAVSLKGRPAAAETMGGAAPFRLFSLLLGIHASGRFEDYAALARHADLEAWLAKKASGSGEYEVKNLPLELDLYQAEHLQGRFALPGVSEKFKALRAFASLCAEHLWKPFLLSRRLGTWREPLTGLLVELYETGSLDKNRTDVKELIAFCQALDQVFSEIEHLPAELQPECGFAQALSLILPMLEGSPLPAETDREAIELLEWLELPLDNAPLMLIAGLSEGLVPEALNADMFLPDSLRRQLGLLDNSRRYARDLYFLQSILDSREVCCLVAGRTSLKGDPLQPSRLLSACAPEKQAARVSFLYNEEGDEAGPGAHEPREGKAFCMISQPEPPQPPISSMRVTGFADYLSCPYRFYLRHVLKLERVSDQLSEMDPRVFGNITHNVLQCLAAEPKLALASEEKIAGFLIAKLDEQAQAVFGSSALASVYVQLEHLKLRLKNFAAWQAEHARAGWRIEACEFEINSDRVYLSLPDGSMSLRGRIDRIDRHQQDGTLLVLDYKTGEKGIKENTLFSKSDGWKDLQLPLYRYALEKMGRGEMIDLGYLSLSASPEVPAIGGLALSDQSYAEALQTAEKVSREVRAGKFWPPAKKASRFSDYEELFAGSQYMSWDEGSEEGEDDD